MRTMKNNHIMIKASVVSTVLAMLCNLFLAYVAYAVCRIAFVTENYELYREGLAELSMVGIVEGSFMFDTSAILYTNVLYAVLMLLPLHYKEMSGYQRVCKVLFVMVNSLAVIVNLADAVYFTYTGHRTTMSVMGEFSNESNLTKIITTEFVNHWYLVVVGVLIIYAIRNLYVMPQSYKAVTGKKGRAILYYVVQLMCLLAFVPLCIGGMRGGFTTAVRPITISNANQYVNHPTEAAIVLNTPFSLIRTIGKSVFYDPEYYEKSELDAIYTPLHNVGGIGDSTVRDRRNVVVLIVESFGREYIGAYNEKLDGGHYEGFTPFMDSLLPQCLTFDFTFANGRQSIDGMPSILSSIPRFIEPFFLTPSSLNDVSGIAGELSKCGYSTAFFHGAENGSMGFEAFSRTTGFTKYYGRTEFCQDERFRGDADYDGTWAIWDEPFLQYYALQMSEMKEPFATAVFTASSHHPYAIPEDYKERFPDDGENPIHKCIRYVDMSLKRFFDTAKKQPWYKNTIFVITSDHTNLNDHQEYATDLGLFGSPIMFFDPSGRMPRGRRHCIAQQIDIMPTVLQYLGYSNPYVAFGCDLLNTADNDTWAVNHSNGIYQFVKGDYVIQFNGNAVVAAYMYKTDWFMTTNLVKMPEHRPAIDAMERELKAIIQSYMQRMMSNQLVFRNDSE